MTNWLVPSNPYRFRLSDFLCEHECVDWKRGRFNFQKGDMIYMYSTKPIQKIEYVLEVIQTDICYEDSIKDEKYWGDKDEFRAGIVQNRYCRFKLVERVSSKLLSIEHLCQHGLKKPPQSSMKIQPMLLEYIHKTIEATR